MGDDADKGTGTPVDREPEEDDAKIDVGRLVQDELASIRGMAELPAEVERGPSPRALSKARIHVKSEPHAPRVRSSNLQPLRRIRTGQNPLLKLNTPDASEEAPSPRNVPKTAPLLPDLVDAGTPEAPKVRRRLLEPLQVIAALLLLETALMPSLRARHVVAPWSAWTDPASPNFVALAFMGLLALFFAFPLSRFMRTTFQGGTAFLLVAFSVILMRSALVSGLFDGQPALHALFIDGLTGGFVVLLALCVVITALFWLHVVPESRRARGCLVMGSALTLVTYFGLAPLTGLEEAPLALLFEASSESPFLGDRLAAWMAMLPLVGVVASMVVWLPGERGGFMGWLGGLVWLFSFAPLLILALYVATGERWQDVLVPIQVSSLLAAGMLLVPTTLGHLLAVREVGEF